MSHNAWIRGSEYLTWPTDMTFFSAVESHDRLHPFAALSRDQVAGAMTKMFGLSEVLFQIPSVGTREFLKKHGCWADDNVLHGVSFLQRHGLGLLDFEAVYAAILAHRAEATAAMLAAAMDQATPPAKTGKRARL